MSIMRVPEIPIWLAEARGCDPLPWQDSMQDSMQDGSWMTSQAGVGMSFDNAYLFDASWPATQYAYNEMMLSDPPIFTQSFEHAGGPPIFYERAKGLPGAAVPPAVHIGGDREAGVQLPYPGHHPGHF